MLEGQSRDYDLGVSQGGESDRVGEGALAGTWSGTDVPHDPTMLADEAEELGQNRVVRRRHGPKIMPDLHRPGDQWRSAPSATATLL